MNASITRKKPSRALFNGVSLFIILFAFLCGSYIQSQLFKPVNAQGSGDISVEGVVPSEPPSSAAVITKPTKNQRFTSPKISVSGTCTGTNITIEIYKNGVFAGSTSCNSSGFFELQIDLLFGKNTLLAKIKDSLDQYGPDSKPVVVFLDITKEPSAGISQLLLTIDADYRGAFPNKELTIRPAILGGKAPYALKIEWGDNSEEIIPRESNGQFNIGHTYDSPGNKTISLTATDSAGQSAYIQTIAVINGETPQNSDDGSTNAEEPEQKTVIVTRTVYWLTFIVSFILFIFGLIVGLILRKKRRQSQPLG